MLKIIAIKRDEWGLVLASAALIFVLFLSYAILRPLRDALGLSGGSEELKWLFLGTFFASLLGSLAASWACGVFSRRHYASFVFGFFAFNLLLFFMVLKLINHDGAGFLWLCRIFYIWASVFNLFVISTAWSVIADSFLADSSKRLFGIVAAGASVGSLCGAGFVAFLGQIFNIEYFFLISALFLCLGIFLKEIIFTKARILGRFRPQNLAQNLSKKDILEGFKIIFKSRFLLGFVGFILLLSAVSTFLYMEQARVISGVFATRAERVAAFARIDFIVQLCALLIQLFFTAQIVRRLGLAILLSIVGVVVCFGFLWLYFASSFLAMVIIMSIRRVGEYSLVKPGREMLFVGLSKSEKYKVKNLLDTLFYRLGDAISAQIEGALAKFSIGASLLFGSCISAIWGLLGFYLGKSKEKMS